MQEANKVQQEILKNAGVEKFEDLKDDLDEIQAQQDEISDFWAQQAEVGNEDALAELDNLEAELAMDELNAVPMSNVPIAN